MHAQALYSNAADAARAHWDTCIAAAKVAGDAKLCAEKLFRETSNEVPDRNPQKLALLKMAQELYALLSRVGNKAIINNDQIKLEIMSIEMAYANASRQARRVVQADPVASTPIVVVPEVKISR
ncbi:MAG: hypothetical protein EBR89_12425 [Betaproteobacteria bacterium]|nr:hypothetical protein [Betaproteobacteria bacterium]NBX05383.1 hypothetical protein [Betaproteobacteria bacterium]